MLRLFGIPHNYMLTHSRPPADAARNLAKPPNEKAKNYDSDLILDQPNKRPAAERHVSRNSASTAPIPHYTTIC